MPLLSWNAMVRRSKEKYLNIMFMAFPLLSKCKVRFDCSESRIQITQMGVRFHSDCICRVRHVRRHVLRIYHGILHIFRHLIDIQMIIN